MDYYDNIASGYYELHSKEQKKKLILISHHLKVDPHDRLLDVGCGTGLSSEVFNCKIVGVDPSQGMVSQGRKRRWQNMDFVQGEAEHLPFAENSNDIVICVTAIHNFKDPTRGLMEIRRVGKGKGAITLLKKSKRLKEIDKTIRSVFAIEKVVEEDKDIIFFFG